MNENPDTDEQNGFNIISSLKGFAILHSSVSYVQKYNIILRQNNDNLRSNCNVKLISGGGSGHEPAHLGYVGNGMLHAAVCGDIFASPAVTNCLAAIANVAKPDNEVLVIIKNYTGDRLNFGLACEMARSIYGYKNIEMLIVDDDCAIDNPSNSTGRRGLCGVVLIHKIAGAMSALGMRLKDITIYCQHILSSRLLRTIGFCFQSSNGMLQIDIGMGIHGEPAAHQLTNERNFNRIIEIIIDKLKLTDVIAKNIAIIFNNLGGTSDYLFCTFVDKFMENIKRFPFDIQKCYAGQYLSSLNKEGLSVTILELNTPDILTYLEYPVEVPVHHLFSDTKNHTNKNMNNIDILTTNTLNATDHFIIEAQHHLTSSNNVTALEEKLTYRIIEVAAKQMLQMENELNKLDSEYGDGDTGTSIAHAGESLLMGLKSNSFNMANPKCLMHQISADMMKSMGGTLGALWSIFFQCATKAFNDNACNRHTVKIWLEAIKLGNNGIEYYGKAKLGDRTMLDALREGEKALLKYDTDKHMATNRFSGALNAFADGCRAGAIATLKMMPKSGRAAYAFADKLSDYIFESSSPDAGAYAISRITESMLSIFVDEGLVESTETPI